ncbi:hypothetical protein DYY67_0494 [Candidatus Nitrosotalea sp. TS]|uniref:hypothetical protein n=1 Tax=Candidatus Nitrosotalea sp. TS TaxID=2341020 RepID=UPI001EB8880E|nr:hypothetical protein [Candidatus Nitrosotalea sp. TS]NHI02455.1 hypothetical protein [Candidatus Nitrosotalea sp. TS]
MLREAITKWRQVENCYYELILSEDGSAVADDVKIIEETIKETKKEFTEALSSDFNTSLAS